MPGPNDYLVVVVVDEDVPDGLGVVVVVLLVEPVEAPVPLVEPVPEPEPIPLLDPVPLVEPVPEPLDVSVEEVLLPGVVVVELVLGVVLDMLPLLGVVVVLDEVVDFSLDEGDEVVVVVVSLVLPPELDLSPHAVKLKAAIREANRTEYFMMFPFYKIKNKDVIVSVQKTKQLRITRMSISERHHCRKVF